MNRTNFNDALVSIPTDSGGKEAFDNRPQTRFRSQDFDFKKPRFSERNSNPRIPLSVNRSKLSIPYKSELCLSLKRGKCYHGENCHFSHTVSEIRKNTVGEMKECGFFARGEQCPFGDRCQYLHERGDNRQSCAITVVNRGGDRSGSSIAGAYHNKMKTRLCIIYDRFGRCFYGEECRFAHGKEELEGHGSRAEPEKGQTSRSKSKLDPGYDPEKGQTSSSKSKLDLGYDPTVLSEKELKTLEKMKQKGKGTIEKINKVYGDWIDDADDFNDTLRKFEGHSMS